MSITGLLARLSVLWRWTFQATSRPIQPSSDEREASVYQPSCCCCSVAQSCPTLCNSMHCSKAFLSITNSWSLLKLMSIESVMPSNHLIPCRLLLLLPSVFPSIRVFSNELSPHIRWPKNLSFSISPSNEYSGLIYFRIDWFDLLAVQCTLKSLLQHHSSKSINSSMLSSLWFNSYIYTLLLEKP